MPLGHCDGHDVCIWQGAECRMPPGMGQKASFLSYDAVCFFILAMGSWDGMAYQMKTSL
jgi:hypothetical protein